MKLRSKMLCGLVAWLACINVVNAENRLDLMISPAFHPVTFEDPRNQSELRFIYAYHKLDDQFVTAGGDVQVYALQARYAINDRFSIIATKDGYVDFNPNSVLAHDEGFANIEAGAKYAFYMDEAAGRIASLQLRYELPTGDDQVLQGNGDGFIHPSVSSAVALSDNLTFTSGTGMRIAASGKDSTFWDVDAQLDYRIDTDVGAFYPLVGVSMIHVVDGGKRLPIADEGQDFFSFGSSGADGENIVTGVAGLRYRIGCDFDLGASYQFPFNEDEGNRVIDHRWTYDAIYRF